MRTKKVPISVKNRDFSAEIDRGIGLVSGTSAWYLLQDETPHFLRRYLNVLADRPSEGITSEENNAINYL
jgi:hypothetical protein